MQGNNGGGGEKSDRDRRGEGEENETGGAEVRGAHDSEAEGYSCVTDVPSGAGSVPEDEAEVQRAGFHSVALDL